MIYTLLILVLGIFIEKKYAPRLSFEGHGVYFHYTKKRGARNKTFLFAW